MELIIESDKKLLQWILKILLAILVINFWYILIPAILIWYIWKKTKRNERERYIGTALALVLLALFTGLHSHLNKIPTLSIIEPEDGFTTQISETTIKGSINPENATLDISGIVVNTENGTFDYPVKLINEKNTFVLKVSNNNGKSEQQITINRTFTKEELLNIEKQKAENLAKRQSILEAQKRAEEIKKAEELAEQKAWDQSSAGQIYKAHPEWSKADCEKLANNKIWIGMTLSMLKYRRGLPNSSNPSNYGFGNEWQWCWKNYTPSCFYGNDDGIIDSYN